MKVHELIRPNEADRQATEMSYPNVYDPKNLDYGKRKKIRREKVTIKDTTTGKIFGRRTVFQTSTE